MFTKTIPCKECKYCLEELLDFGDTSYDTITYCIKNIEDFDYENGSCPEGEKE